MTSNYDLIIIGSGPAGLAGALYATRYSLKTMIISDKLGGEMGTAFEIENYPGYEKISGAELTEKIIKQIQKYGVEIVNAKVTEIKEIANGFGVKADQSYQAKTILIAVGTHRRKLNIPGEKDFFGKGVAYCATCDGPLYRGKNVIVVGGGNAGLASAFHMSKICPKVYLIEATKEFNADPFWQNRIKGIDNVEVLLGVKVKKIEGDEVVKKVILETPKGEKSLDIEGVFVEIGSIPNVELAKKLELKLNERDFIKIDPSGATSKKGVWAAGDITTGSNFVWQILPSMAEGAIAVHSIFKYLGKNSVNNE